MGCDIHLFQEVKVGGRWVFYNHPDVERDYDLFAIMGNVRNAGALPSLSDRRGLPPDATETTKLYDKYWGEDGHSHIYLSREEVFKVEEFYRDYVGGHLTLEGRFGYLFGNEWTTKPHGIDLEDFRWIFWFDN